MILGVQQIGKELRELSKVELKQGITKGISFVQERAKGECPAHDGELRESIFTAVEENGDSVRGICFTNKKYGPYVEFGTGPRGQESHEGISPDVTVAYTQSPWWIHESQIDRSTAEYYRFFYVDTPEGRFYQCTGQAAHPYMYPALKNSEKNIVQIMADTVRRQI